MQGHRTPGAGLAVRGPTPALVMGESTAHSVLDSQKTKARFLQFVSPFGYTWEADR